MTIDEKLQHFYDTAVGEAQKEAAQLLEAHRQRLKNQLEDHKQTKQHEVEIQLKAESDHVSREVNKALSASQLAIKRKWTKRELELTDKIFQEVELKLRDFMKTGDYTAYLEKKIREAVDFAGEDSLTIYLSPEDADKADSLAENTQVALQIADATFMGGIKAIIPSKNILIDNTFASALTNERSKFSFDGGLKYE